MTPALPQPTNRPRAGVIVALLLLLVGFVSIVWTPYPVDVLDVGAALQGPSAGHWLGTDPLGRDVLSLLMKGLLTSFVVAGVGAALGAVLGVPLGLVAARWPRLAAGLAGLDALLLALPALVLAMLFAVGFGPGAPSLMLTLGIVAAPGFARATLAGSGSAVEPGYVTHSRLAGMTDADIWRRHLLPDLVRLLVGTAVLQIGAGILAEAALSYLGLGVQPPASSLGLMLRDAQSAAMSQPLLAVLPGLLLTLAGVALSLAGRGVLRLVDPRRLEGAAHAA